MRQAAAVMAALGSLWGSAALAQIVPPASQVRPPVIAPAPSTARISLPQVPAGGQIPAEAKKLSFVLIDFDIEGEFKELVARRKELAAPLIGKRITVADVFVFADKLQQAYVQAGYPLVRVVILPQQLADKARAKLRVIDGFVERIDAAAIAERVREWVAAVVMPLLFQRHLTQGDLERRLLIAGEAAGLDLNATFAAGKEVGGSVLVMTGRFRPVSASIYSDNSMPKVFGTGQIVATASINSPSYVGDQITVSAAGLPDRDWGSREPTRRYLSGTYTAPIGMGGWFFELYGTDGRTTPRVDPSLATQGLFQQGHVKLSYELLKRRDYELTLNGRYEATDEKNLTLATMPALPLSLDRLRVLRAGMNGIWRWRSTGTTWSFGGNYSRGLDALGARSAADATPILPLSRQGADAKFDKIDGHGELNQSLPESFLATIAGAAQYSFNHALLSAEQFDITGAKALSGLTAGALVGDRGWVARGELGRTFTAPTGAMGSATVTPYLFAATGERNLERPTVLELGSVHATDFGGGTRVNIAGVSEFAPNGYGFVEWSRSHVNLVTAPTPNNTSRIFAGALLQY